MTTKGWIVALAALSALLLPAASAAAAPVPPLRVVNHEAKACGEIFGGDECMDCYPPEGWEILGVASEAACPSGYAVLEDVEVHCRGFKNQFCCSEGHSGAPGNCQDLVVDDRARQCAFVEDISTCTLPDNWTKAPVSVSPREWFCPAEYQWLEAPLACVAAEGQGKETETRRSFCPFAAGIGPAILGLWLLIRRTR
jgi:hypothetical protein